MPPKRKRGDGAVVDDEREKFRKRGDLEMYQTGTKADLALTVEGKKILLHQQFLISRVGYFKQRLTGRDEVSSEATQLAICPFPLKDLLTPSQLDKLSWM